MVNRGSTMTDYQPLQISDLVYYVVPTIGVSKGYGVVIQKTGKDHYLIAWQLGGIQKEFKYALRKV